MLDYNFMSHETKRAEKVGCVILYMLHHTHYLKIMTDIIQNTKITWNGFTFFWNRIFFFCENVREDFVRSFFYLTECKVNTVVVVNIIIIIFSSYSSDAQFQLKMIECMNSFGQTQNPSRCQLLLKAKIKVVD